MLGVYLQLRFTSLGGFFWVLSHEPQKVHNFGHMMDVLGRLVLVNRWLVSPVAAFVAGCVARLIAQRSDWVRCIVIILPIAALNSVWDQGLSGLAQSIMYVVVAFAAMKVVDFVTRTPVNAR